MVEQEGVIKFRLHHEPGRYVTDFNFDEMNAWRTVMHRLDLIGQDPSRYQGYGFGNISHRISKDAPQFLICATQTGHLKNLRNTDYTLIVKADPDANVIYSKGERKPSSESMTHAAIYQQRPDVQSIIHAHCPEIWRNSQALGIPRTNDEIEYGTVAMAQAVVSLLHSADPAQLSILTMAGHRDGVFTFGRNIASAARCMIDYLAMALAME